MSLVKRTALLLTLGVALAGSTHAQSSGCLSAVANACQGGVYNENVVVDYYTPIFQLMAENPSLSPEGPGPGNICIASCEAAYRANVSACRSLPNDDPVIGEGARDTCIQVSEEAYRRCLEGCIFD